MTVASFSRTAVGRRGFLAGTAAAAALTPAFPLFAQDAVDPFAVSETDMVLGDRDAPVTILAFESLTCGHCAAFHGSTHPELKTRYLDEGHAKLIFRDFPLDQLALVAAVLARCAGEERFWGMLTVLFRTQSAWTRSNDPIGELSKVARMGGLSQEKFESCISDEATANVVLENRLQGTQVFDVASTPTFVLNGPGIDRARIVGNQDIDAFAELIDPTIET